MAMGKAQGFEHLRGSLCLSNVDMADSPVVLTHYKSTVKNPSMTAAEMMVLALCTI